MIYLDHSATTPLLPAVKTEMLRVMELDFGNPSSLHTAGQLAKSLINEARAEIAQLIEARPQSVIFTSGGSESNNTVIQTFSDCPIFISAIEHPSVLTPAEIHGAPCVKIPVNRQGIIDLNFLQAELENSITNHPKSKILVSIMLANNETGIIEPIHQIAQIIKHLKTKYSARIYLHTDATQAVGKIPVSVKDLGCDYLTFTSHKLGGPVGISALYIKPGSPFKPLILGGAQENKRRAGTSNVLLASGFKIAAQEAKKNLDKYQEVAKLRDYLAEKITEEIPNAKIISIVKENRLRPRETVSRNFYENFEVSEPRDDGSERTGLNEVNVCSLPNILNISFPAAEGESTQLYLDLEHIEVSTGSACASGDLEPSHVLMAMYHDAEIAHGSIRFSLNTTTTKSEIDELIQKLPAIITKIQAISTIKQRKS